MAKCCFYCHVYYQVKNNLSFYLFPVDISLRKSWFNALGLEYDDRHFIYLCSKHFSSNDFQTLRNGLLRLKKEAIPCAEGSNSKFLDYTAATISPDKNKCPSSVKNDTSRREFLVSPTRESLPIQTENVHSDSSTITLTDPEHEDIHSGSSTITVTDPEHDISDLDSLKNRRFIRPRYIRHCKKKFVGISEKDKKKWNQTIRIIQDQRRKIRLLQQTRRRFKSKVSSLKSLLLHLKQKSWIFDKSTSTNEATVPESFSEIKKKDSFEEPNVTEIFNGSCPNIEFIFEESS